MIYTDETWDLEDFIEADEKRKVFIPMELWQKILDTQSCEVIDAISRGNDIFVGHDKNFYDGK